MNDMEQALYDSLKKELDMAKKEVLYYKQLSESWCNVAYYLMSIEKLRKEEKED